MTDQDQQPDLPSDFPLPSQWESLASLPTQDSAARLAQTGSNGARLAIGEAAAGGLRRAAAMSGDRLLWALAARLKWILDRMNSGKAGRDRVSVKIMLTELAWSVACEIPTDGWPTTDDHLQRCSESFTDEFARDGDYVRAFIHSRYRPDGTTALSEEDMEQVVWLSIYKTYWSSDASRRFQAHASLRTKLCTIARHAISNARKRHAARRGDGRHLAEDAAAEVADRSTDWIRLESQELSERARQLAQRLPDGQRQVFEWHDLDTPGLTVTEIARRLGTSKPNVVQQRNKAREKILGWLDSAL